MDAPYIDEFPFVLECKLINNVKIGLHTQFIGEIKDIKLEESLLDGDEPLIGKINPLIYSTDNLSYYGVGKFLGKAFSIGKKF